MVKFTARIIGKSLDDLNEKLITFLKDNSDILKGRSIQTYTDDETKQYHAVISIDESLMVQNVKKAIGKLPPKKRESAVKKLTNWIRRQ